MRMRPSQCFLLVLRSALFLWLPRGIPTKSRREAPPALEVKPFLSRRAPSDRAAIGIPDVRPAARFRCGSTRNAQIRAAVKCVFSDRDDRNGNENRLEGMAAIESVFFNRGKRIRKVDARKIRAVLEGILADARERIRKSE